MGSASTSLGNFGRAWSITITPSNGPGPLTVSNRAGAESLRATFEIDEFIMATAYWIADISIYNLSTSSVGTIQQGSPTNSQTFTQPLFSQQPLVAGDAVSISAGYLSTPSGPFFQSNGDVNPSSLLYTGRVFQSIWTREKVVDSKLILRCVTGAVDDASNFVSFSLNKGATDYDAINQIAKSANIPIERIDDNAMGVISQAAYSRGQVFNGRPYGLINQILKQYPQLTAWYSPVGLNIRLLVINAPWPTPAYAYGPPNLSGSYAPNGTTTGTIKPTLIGTPEQTQEGMTFRVLLDSQVKVGDYVQLAPGTVINAFQFGFHVQRPAFPNSAGIYAVAGVRHVGDTRGRGDDWFTELTCVTQGFFSATAQSRIPGSK